MHIEIRWVDGNANPCVCLNPEFSQMTLLRWFRNVLHVVVVIPASAETIHLRIRKSIWFVDYMIRWSFDMLKNNLQLIILRKGSCKNADKRSGLVRSSWVVMPSCNGSKQTVLSNAFCLCVFHSLRFCFSCWTFVCAAWHPALGLTWSYYFLCLVQQPRVMSHGIKIKISISIDNHSSCSINI